MVFDLFTIKGKDRHICDLYHLCHLVVIRSVSRKSGEYGFMSNVKCVNDMYFLKRTLMQP